jgi:hypothetical protein
MAETPKVNAWTEWGQLEACVNVFYSFVSKLFIIYNTYLHCYIFQVICVGRADNACYPNVDPCCDYNEVRDEHQARFMTLLGQKPTGICICCVLLIKSTYLTVFSLAQRAFLKLLKN